MRRSKGCVASVIGLFLATVFLMPERSASAAAPGRGSLGSVYTMTNSASGNEVVVFERHDDGSLRESGTVSTGGNGSGGGSDTLGSQGSIILAENAQWLMAVNAGSDDISVFKITSEGLMRSGKTASGGAFPVSLTARGDQVWVLNSGGSPSIAGFRLNGEGGLVALPDAVRHLGPGKYAQVGFTPDGRALLVTDKTDDEILAFSFGSDGSISRTPARSASNGAVPFGFTFDQGGHLLVVEAGANAVSSYRLLPDGKLKVISPSVADGQHPSCWIAGTEHYAFTANPGSSNISSFKLDPESGKLSLLRGVAGKGKSPLDLGIADGRFLYALDPRAGAIDLFRIEADGSLSELGTAGAGLPLSAQGIAVR